MGIMDMLDMRMVMCLVFVVVVLAAAIITTVVLMKSKKRNAPVHGRPPYPQYQPPPQNGEHGRPPQH